MEFVPNFQMHCAMQIYILKYVPNKIGCPLGSQMQYCRSRSECDELSNVIYLL